ncbi:MAG: energy transducer TonB [Candidatus Sphingomonas phytovorans]|nr:energy transducer TonB [Sphingomonas sp.]WEJ97962.1 MAG: energy transducer TonB [Sphingomonas sp.]
MILFILLLAAQADTAAANALDASRPRPDGNIGSWFSEDDYPTQALREQASGTVAFTVDVDASGAPVKCIVTKGTDSPSLDNGTCTVVMQKGRFIAGRDATGRAVAGQYSSRIRWEMPQATGPRVLITVSGADNSVCTFELDGKTRHLNPANCRGLAYAVVQGGRSLNKPISIQIPDVPGMMLPEGQ